MTNTLRKVDFFGWWLEQQLPTARASFGPKKIHFSERDNNNDWIQYYCDIFDNPVGVTVIEEPLLYLKLHIIEKYIEIQPRFAISNLPDSCRLKYFFFS